MTKKVIKETYLLYLPFKGTTQSIAVYYDDGTNKVLYTDGKTVEEYKAESPDIVEWSNEEWTQGWNEYIQSLKTDPVSITQDKYDYALNVLPPGKWSKEAGIESFYVTEAVIGDLVSWYAKAGDNCFTFVDSFSLKKQEVDEKVAKVL